MSANFKYDHAYPVATVDGFTQHGLTKRELFAAMAMQGLIQHAATIDTGGRPVAEFVCEAARMYADALMAELERTA